MMLQVQIIQQKGRDGKLNLSNHYTKVKFLWQVYRIETKNDKIFITDFKGFCLRKWFININSISLHSLFEINNQFGIKVKTLFVYSSNW